MKVELINPQVVKDLYKNHGQFACVCYDTPEKYAERVGKSCQADGHMSGSRCEYIKFRISDVDRGTAEQSLRHEIGTFVPWEMQDNYTYTDMMDMVRDVNPAHIVKNMASFRYIDKDGFSYETPITIQRSKRAKKLYDELMAEINEKRRQIKEALEESCVDPKRATQDANFVLPRATTTEFMIGFTPEALIHFMHKRLCTRSQEFIREMARQMRFAVEEHNPKFAQELVPQCEHLLWCPEGKRSCGMKPTKDTLKMFVDMHTR